GIRSHSRRAAAPSSSPADTRTDSSEQRFFDKLKMPLLSRRRAAEKSSLRSLNALPCKAFRAFDPTRGGLPPPRAPPPTLGRIRLNRGFSTSCGARLCFQSRAPVFLF